MLVILRLGHRLGRDQRISTHCGLVARAFGAQEIIYTGDKDESLLESVNKVAEKWGGPFSASYSESWKSVIKKYRKKKYVIIHLTVYGIPIQKSISKIRRKKNLLVIPVTEVKGKMVYDKRLGYYRQRYWQGAYVFGVTPEDGFKVKGTITHNEDDELDRYYWWGSPNVVRRSLYMDDILYTVSATKIKANDLNNIDNEIKEIKLPYEKENYPYPIYGGVAVPSRGGVETAIAVE